MSHKNFRPRRRFKRTPTVSKNTKAFVDGQIKKNNKKMIETKFHDFAILEDVTAVPPFQVHQLNDIDDGTLVNQRVGLQARLSRIDVNILYTVSDSTNVVRQLLFVWNEKGPVEPILTDILAFPTITSNYNVNALGSYTILSDRLIILDTVSFHQKQSKYSRKVSRRMQWSSLIGTLFVKNSIWLIHFSDSLLGGHPKADIYTRLHFTDA